MSSQPFAPLSNRPAAEPRESLIADQLEPPHRSLEMCVVLPARNEEIEIAACLQALATQREVGPDQFEVILVANNCDDATAERARALRRRLPTFRLQVVEIALAAEHAHVGWARRLAMNEAQRRLDAVRGGARGFIATTDADTVVDARWLAHTRRALRTAEVSAVGGYITPQPASFRRLPAGLRARGRSDLLYKLLATQMEERICPTPFDPWPRHFFHNGASLAVRPQAYAEVGGLPAWPAHEDMEFHRRLEALGLVTRHDLSVRVSTSARRHGRVAEGMAGTLQKWEAELEQGQTAHLVEAPPSLRARARHRRDLRAWHLRQLIPRQDQSLRLAEPLGCSPFLDATLLPVLSPGLAASVRRPTGAPSAPLELWPVEEAIRELRDWLRGAESLGGRPALC